MRIITNNHWHNFKYRDEVPTSVLADQFAYQDESVIDRYFQYRGHWYHLDEFMRSREMSPDWHGYAGDSYLSGVLIRISDDCEQYQIATYIS